MNILSFSWSMISDYITSDFIGSKEMWNIIAAIIIFLVIILLGGWVLGYGIKKILYVLTQIIIWIVLLPFILIGSIFGLIFGKKEQPATSTSSPVKRTTGQTKKKKKGK